MTHPVAADGFGQEASTYDRVRPSYPGELVDWVATNLSTDDAGVVADVGAGSGIFTRLLVPRCPDLIAVEPVATMRAICAASLPAVPVVGATGESLPFRDESLAAITVAQAFHWFDATNAFAEFARVLQPGGRIALFWNTRDRSLPWTDRLWGMVAETEHDAPWGDAEHWHTTALVDTPHFGPRHNATFHHEQLLTPDEIVARVQSVSHVAVLPEAERAALLDRVRELLRTDPATAGREEIPLPYRVDAYWAART
ncbi:MAG: class I SAM-dependent methyltransferase [Acidimicrobiia bacterium]